MTGTQAAPAAATATAPDPATELVKLRQSEPLGVLDDHDGGGGNIDADLDHGGRHQEVDDRFAGRRLRRLAGKGGGDALLVRRTHPAVQ